MNHNVYPPSSKDDSFPWHWLLLACVLLGIAALVGLVYWHQSTMRAALPPEPPRSADAIIARLNSERSPTINRPITYEKFRQLRNGMGWGEVKAIMGEKHAKVVMENNIAGYHHLGVQWTNPDGSNVLAIFQNGELKSVAQAGL